MQAVDRMASLPDQVGYKLAYPEARAQRRRRVLTMLYSPRQATKQHDGFLWYYKTYAELAEEIGVTAEVAETAC